MQKKISKNRLAGIGILGMLCLLLTSCLKTNQAPISPPTALVTFIQASPDEPPLNFFLNTNRVNQDAINYGDDIDYFSAFAGERTAYFYTAGSGGPIVSSTFTLTANAAYSLFLVNTPVKPGIFLLQDTLIKPATGNASVRFINLSPDAPAVDVAVQGGAVLVPNKSFEGYSSFMAIAGKNTYTFQVLKKGTSDVLSTLPNVLINDGFVYTLLLHGLNASTNNTDKLSVGLITNASFY